MEFDYDIDCIKNGDLTDFFKFMYQGYVKIEIYDFQSLFKIGEGSCNILSSLRQGKDFQTVGY